jgi:hypothetical protein
MSGDDRLVVRDDPDLHAHLQALARLRMVFVAGLPGTGKSLVVHQLAHLAAAAGRRVHLLQWDVARPVFEATETGRRYPVVDGVTQPLVRRAVGRWARRAIVECAATSPGALLLGETPFVGGRLIELARPADDAAEALLAAPDCRFAIAVPSVEVRRFLEEERARRAAAPRHPREREDAPPDVLRDLWRQLASVARTLGLEVAAGGDPPYDPDVYRAVFEAVLRRRRVEVVSVRTVLPTGTMSAYDLGASAADLLPDPEEADRMLREVEAAHPDPGALAREVDRWWT